MRPAARRRRGPCGALATPALRPVRQPPRADADAVRTLEELTAAAWPAVEQIRACGWLLRFGAGYTRRANCVLPLRGAETAVEWCIDYCEREYAARELPTVFKMLPAVAPRSLARRLAARGYRVDAESLVMTCALSAPPASPEPPLRLLELGPWVDVYARCTALPPPHRALLIDALTRVPASTLFAALFADGAPVSCAMVVPQGAHAGIFCVATLKALRGQGHGRQLMRALLGRARQQGARSAYLQVLAANAPAVHLYQGLGFVTAYSYHYLLG